MAILLALALFSISYNRSYAQEETMCHLARPCESYRPLLEQYDWDVDTVLKIMKGESGFRNSVYCKHWALNDTPATRDYSVGLMQVNLFGNLALERPSEEELKIPEKNIAFAYKIYSDAGTFIPWGVCTNGTVNCGL